MQTANEYLEECKDIICKEIFKKPSLAGECHISYGFPSKGAMAKVNRSIGQAWQHENKEAIFINPFLFDKGNEIIVLSTLIHELIHIKIGTLNGHRNGFKAAMKEVGLEGKATATVPSAELIDRLNNLNFPEMPELKLDSSKVKKQGTRLLLLMCGCARKLRLSRKVAEEGGIHCKLCDSEFEIQEVE